MAIPFSTTYISIVRSTLTVAEDPYDAPSAYPVPDSRVIAANVRAVVSVPSANVQLSIGDRVVYTSKLTCDPCDLQEGDEITESSGRIWVALAPTRVQAFAIDCVEATLRLTQGYAG